MDTRNKQHRWLLHLLGAAILLLGLAACGSSEGPSEDEPNKPKPEAPVDDGDWQTVPATGGTIEKGDITITFPSGTFSEEAKVAITEVESSGIVGEDARSKFYQVILPTIGTLKSFTIKLKCTGSTDNVRPIIKTPGLDIHSGEACYMKVELESTESNGEIITSIPIADGGGTENPYFTIGLVEGPPESATASTRATTIRYVYRNGVSISEYKNKKELYQKLNNLMHTNIPKALSDLSARNFNIKTTTIYRLTEPKEVKNLPTCWGLFQITNCFKDLAAIYLNKDSFVYYAEKPTKELLNELEATLIHESLHSVTCKDYDPRSAKEINTEGKAGDDWAQFDEAMGCWVEKFVGKKVVGGNNTINHQEQFLSAFYPTIRDWVSSRNTGYGMATFLEFLSKKAGNNSLVEIYEYQKKGTKSFRDALKKFMDKYSITFFNTKDYYDFAFSVISNKFDSRIYYGNIISDNNRKNIQKEHHFKKDVFNYGVAMQNAIFYPSTLNKYADSTIFVTQNNDAVLTRIYYLKGKDLIQIGQSVKGDTVWIPVKELCKYYGYNDVKDVTGGKENVLSIILTTTRISNLEDYSSLPSDITVNFCSEQQKYAYVKPTELTFPAEGGTQTVTVTAKGYKKYNHEIDNEYKSWLSGKNNSAGKLDITAQPNTTGKERVGYVKPYVLIDENSTERVYLTPVKVTQAADEKQGDDTQSEFKIVSGAIHMYYAVAWRHDMSFKAGDEFSTITPKGKGANVKYVQSGRDTGANATWKITVTFDVDDLSLVNVQKAKLSNFKFVYERVQGEYNYYRGHVDYGREDATMESKVSKSQNANGIWYFEAGDLTYHQESMLHYDAWKKDYYSKPEEHTDRSETDVVTDGSYVNISLNVEKKK